MFGRINETQPVLRLRNEMDRLFGELADGPLANIAMPFVCLATFPAVNLWEDERNLFAEAELPGLKMDDLEVFISGAELTIRGRRTNQPEGTATYHRRERGAGSFCRVLSLPIEVDANKVEASLRDGVLRITLPKADAVLPHKIPVRA